MFDFETEYPNWRESKLANCASQSSLAPVIIQDPSLLTKQELQQLDDHCKHNNFIIYRLHQPSQANKASISAMIKQIGMLKLDQNLCADNDSISSIQVMDLGRARGYIPYTAKALSWHTDGYYNPLPEHIHSFLLHCIQNAPSGGNNMLINHELIYIQLFDEEPALVAALMQPDALTIPANVEDGIEVRPEQTGPVFYKDTKTNTLQMRYTSRSHSIHWKQDVQITRAVCRIEELLKDSAHVLHYTLQPGEGLICNNILHGRSAFTNGNIPEQQRVMYRARSYNRLFTNN